MGGVLKVSRFYGEISKVGNCWLDHERRDESCMCTRAEGNE